MAAFSKLTLSGSTDGRPILVAATSGTGTTVHTCSSTATVYDEIWLYAHNSDTTSRKLTVQFGGTTDPNDVFEVTLLPENGLVLVVPGLVIKGNATPLVVRAFASAANVVTVSGFVNRIT